MLISLNCSICNGMPFTLRCRYLADADVGRFRILMYCFIKLSVPEIISNLYRPLSRCKQTPFSRQSQPQQENFRLPACYLTVTLSHCRRDTGSCQFVVLGGAVRQRRWALLEKERWITNQESMLFFFAFLVGYMYLLFDV